MSLTHYVFFFEIGLDQSQKDMFLNLLNGNSVGLKSQIDSLLGTPNQIEAARLQFLENPELAEAMGLPMDVLRDSAQFAALMAQGIEELSQLDDAQADGILSGAMGAMGDLDMTAGGGFGGGDYTGGEQGDDEDDYEARRSNEAELQRLRKKFLGSFQQAA